MGDIPHANQEAQVRHVLCAIRIHVDMGDVGFGTRQFGGDPCQHPFAIGYGDGNFGFKRAFGLVGPLDLNKALGILVESHFGGGAGGHVHHQALAAPQVAHDIVPRDRATAQRELDRRILRAVQRQRAHQ